MGSVGARGPRPRARAAPTSVTTVVAPQPPFPFVMQTFRTPAAVTLTAVASAAIALGGIPPSAPSFAHTPVTALPVAPPVAPAQAKSKPKAPPGLVLIEGGSTRIGSTAAEVQALGQQNETLFQRVVCETPQHEMRVDDFFLMVNEVTNEQFAEFVTATGRRAPEHWAEAIIDKAQLEFLEAQAKAKNEAKEAGKPFESAKFDRAEWWRKNGQGQPWQIPKGREAHPVVYVDYSDARAYARWAGLRLPTEFEFQRAGRGRGATPYPWGTEPDTKRCANESLRLTEAKRVGSFPAGATAAGVHDLSGNVFEWTSSPFAPYPRFQVLTLNPAPGKQGREIKGEVEWDANWRVVVSGSYQTSMIAARLTTRRPTDREQSTDSLGFRCAASVAPGADIAVTVMGDDLPSESRPKDAVFDVSRTVAIDRWRTREAAAPIDNYAVISGYEYVLFVPTAELDAISPKALAERSVEQGTLALGALSTSVPIVEPALPPGSYIVALRGASRVAPTAEAGADTKKRGGAAEGQSKADDKPVEAPAAIRTPEGWKHDIDTVIFYAPDGTPVAWIPAPSLEYARPMPPTVAIGDSTRKVSSTGADGKHVSVDEPVTIASFKLMSYAKVSNKGFAFTLRLAFAHGAVSNDWRLP